MFTRDMEEDVFSLLGALLGLLEVLSIDVRDPLAPRQRDVLNDALKFGDKLRTRIESLVTLLADESDPRHRASDYSLRRLIDHAIRGASWGATEKGVRMVLPDTEQLAEDVVRIDATRVDRAVRSLTDALVAVVPRGGELLVSVDRPDASIGIELRAYSPDTEIKLELPRLLVLAWQRVFGLHGGNLQVRPADATVRIELLRGGAA